MSGIALLSRATRSFAREMKLATWPSALMEGTRLLPFEAAAEVPVATLTSEMLGEQVAVPVVGRFVQVLRVKIFSIPFAALPDKFEENEAKAMNWPVVRLILGCSLSASPGVVPFDVETSLVDGVHVSVVWPLQVSRT